ncbi:unnamed protein product [Citrullus colocynthis]|uniref:Uncharacterized protein n=1 Tax=Citrullus colocynthis TaxID=252529 RepID=A0ABP0XST9_9ROSI
MDIDEQNFADHLYFEGCRPTLMASILAHAKRTLDCANEEAALWCLQNQWKTNHRSVEPILQVTRLHLGFG